MKNEVESCEMWKVWNSFLDSLADIDDVGRESLTDTWVIETHAQLCSAPGHEQKIFVTNINAVACEIFFYQ